LRLCDSYQIARGRLIGNPREGIESAWEAFVSEYGEALIIELSKLRRSHSDPVCLKFTDYSTGHYGEHKKGGVALQFVNIHTGAEAYSVFNCELGRKRTVGKSKAGERYPGKKFRVGKRHKLMRLWKAWGMPTVTEATLHRKIGLLKGMIFEAPVDSQEKINKDYLKPLEMKWESLKYLIEKHSGLHKGCIAFAQDVHKTCIRTLHKESELDQTTQGLEPNQSECNHNYGIHRKVVGVKGNSHTSDTTNLMVTQPNPIDAANQELFAVFSDVTSTQDGLEPCSSLEVEPSEEIALAPWDEPINKVKLNIYPDPSNQTVEEWLDDYESAPSI